MRIIAGIILVRKLVILFFARVEETQFGHYYANAVSLALKSRS